MAAHLTPLEIQAATVAGGVATAILATVRRLRKQSNVPTISVDEYLVGQLRLMSVRLDTLEREGLRKDERIAELEGEIVELKRQLHE